MRKIPIRRYFTLLELVVTISLIMICFSIIGLNISKALYRHKYQSNIKKIDKYFDFCKKMALSNQADIYMKLFLKGEDIYCEMGTDENIGFFENTEKTKDCFKDMYFLFKNNKVINLEIIFSSTGEILPKGDLIFLDKKNKFKQIKTI